MGKSLEREHDKAPEKEKEEDILEHLFSLRIKMIWDNRQLMKFGFILIIL